MTTQLVPKRRFKGFKGSWKLVQVNEVAEFNPSSILPKKFYYVDLESVEEMKLKKASKEKLETAPSRAQRVARKGDIFYQTVRPYQRNNYLFNLSKRTYVFSTGYAQLRPSIDSSYLINQLITPRFSREVLNRCTGTGYPAISPYNLSTIAIKIPQDKRESQKIGEFFKLLDARIANQERKIEKIKALKQAYLTEMFPQEGEDVPRKRFNDFDSMWQVDELQNLVTFSKGRGYSKKDIQSEGTPLLLYGTLYTNYETMITSLKTFTNLKENSVLSLGGEVVIPSSGETSEDIARASTILDQGIIIGGDLNVLRPKNLICSSYLALNLSNSPTKNQLARKAQGSSVVHLYNEDLKNIKVCYPTIEEQQKIGEFFKTLDEKIESEEKKLEKLKKMKAAFLEEMFV